MTAGFRGEVDVAELRPGMHVDAVREPRSTTWQKVDRVVVDACEPTYSPKVGVCYRNGAYAEYSRGSRALIREEART